MTHHPDDMSFDDELAARIADVVAGDASEDSTIKEARAELDTVAHALQRPAPEDEYAAESACDEAVEALVAMGREPSFDTRERLAGRTPDETPTRELGQYQLVERLGEGGMGAVYKAVHGRLEKAVALKVLPAEKLDDEAALQRFDREMRAVGKLQHPNIVAAFDAGEVDDVHYLVMELVEGEDLSAVVRRRGPLPVAEACELVRQAALGLQHAHEYGMVHRDVKPSNLMLTTDGTVKVLDLGLALLADHHETTTGRELTTTGQLMGTLDYMAPEQGVDTHTVDVRADVYSLGATLYKLLGGEAPFAGGRYDSPIKKLRALAVEDVPPLAERRENLPAGLAEVVHRMLAREPEDRYATPAEVAAALEAFTANAAPATLLEEMDDATAVELERTAESATKLRSTSTADFDPHEETVTAALASAAGRSVPLGSSSGRRRTWSLVAAVALLAGFGYWAATVFFLQTEHGVIRVEITGADADEVEVTLRGTNIVLGGVDDKPVKLKPGEKTLTVTRGDFTFHTDNFVLKPGAEVTVKIDFLPGEVKVSQVGGGGLGGEAIPNGGRVPSPERRFALRFDGIDDRVEIPTLMPPRGAFTVEAWAGVGGGRNVLVKMAQDKETVSLWLGDGEIDGFSVRNFEDKGGVAQTRTPEGRVRGRLCHYAGVFDGESVLLYVDGRLVSRKRSFRTDPKHLFTGTWLGAQASKIGPEERSSSLNGELYEVRVSSVVRYVEDFTPRQRWNADEHTLALYQFDEGSGDVLRDSSGNGHHGKIVGAKWVEIGDESPVPEPYALDFGGDDPAYVRTPIVYDGKTPLTVEAWVVLDERIEQGHLFDNFGNRGEGFIVRTHPNPLRWQLQAKPFLGSLSEVDAALRQGARVHIAAVSDTTTWRLFVDGEPAGSLPVADSASGQSSEGIRIGGRPQNRWFPGQVGEVRISSSARYREWFRPESRFENDEHTLALYHFDEGQGDVLRDSSGNGHHGTIVGAKWVRTASPRREFELQFAGRRHGVVVEAFDVDEDTPLTVEGYVTLNEPGEDNVFFVETSGASLFASGGLGYPGVRFRGVDGGGADLGSRQQVLPRGLRTHVAATWRSGEAVLFVDGRKVKSATKMIPDQLTRAGRLEIGPELNGRVDEVRVSNIVRYQDEFTPAEHHEPDEHTLALYHFDEGQGDVLRDSSGNGHHGTIVGAKWVRVGEPSVSPDVDRLVAELVIRHGGKVSLATTDGTERRNVDAVEKMPEEPFRLRTIYLVWGAREVTDDLFERFRGLPEVEFVDVLSEELTVETLRHLGTLPRLTELQLRGHHMPLKNLVESIGRAPHLTRLVLHELDNEDCRHLPALESLEQLVLTWPQARPDDLAEALGTLSNLEYLHFEGASVRDAHLEVVPRIPTLRTLSFRTYSITDEALRHAANTGLTELYFDNCSKITIDGIEQVCRRLSKLERLTVSDAKDVTRGDVERLHAALPSCEITSDFGRFEPLERQPAHYALRFDGDGDRVELPVTVAPGSPVTLELWVTPGAVGEEHCALWRAGNIGLLQLGRQIQLHGANRGGTSFRERNIVANGAVDVGRRTHIACVLAKNELALFVDGKLVERKDHDALPKAVETLVLGRDPAWTNSDERSFNGSIDELRISSGARFESNFEPSRTFEKDEHTLALYHFDEGQGDVLKDASGNGHDGKILGAKWGQADPDRWAAERILAIGGRVHVDDGSGSREVAAVDELPSEPFRLTGVGLYKVADVTNDELAPLRDCRGLTELNLHSARLVDDAGLAHLRHVDRLEELNLLRTAVTDKGLAQFRDCKSLRRVWLNLTGVTDRGLEVVGTWTGLEQLELSQTRVTDAGLDHLASLESLRSLKLVKTDVTAEGVEQIAKSLPGCRIEWDGGVIEPSDPVDDE